MTPAPPPSTSPDKPPFRRRTWLRLLLCLAAILIILPTLAWQRVNSRGAGRLADARELAQQQGLSLDFRDSLSAPVPDADNFCATPALHDLPLDHYGDTPPVDPGPELVAAEQRRDRLSALALEQMAPDSAERPERPHGHVAGQPFDARAWTDYLGINPPDAPGDPAAALLAALSADPDLELELAAVLDRPAARWTPPWSERELPDLLMGITVPHYNATRHASDYWALRAAAAARSGEPAIAHRCTRIVLRLTEATIDDPFIVGVIFGSMNANIALGAVWEICHARTGSADDFASLANDLNRIDLHAALIMAYRSELCAAVNAVDSLRGETFWKILHILGTGSEAPPELLRRMPVPAGWIDANEAALIRRYVNDVIVPLRDDPSSLGHRGAELEASFDNMKKGFHSDNFLSMLLIPVVVRLERSIAVTRCQLRMAALACALERHALLHDGYPEQLDPSTPEGGPWIDPYSGEPFRYQPTDDGRYRLWSIGPDRTDDGGRRNLDPEITQPNRDGYLGDLVWDYPPSD